MEEYNNQNGNESTENDEINNNTETNNNQVENNDVNNISQNNEIPTNNDMNNVIQNEEETNNNEKNTNTVEQNVQNSSTQNNYKANNVNVNTKKKSKAPIIIVIVLIVVLLLGCLTIGGVALAIKMFSNYSKNEIINKIETTANEINTTNTNSNRNNYTNNTSRNTSNTINNTSNTNNTVNNTTNNNISNNTTTNNSTNKTSSSSVIDAKQSTKENPLEKGTWGIASKYSTESKNYEDVYVKVTNIIRGEEAKKAVQDYINSKSYFKYEEPKEGLEWVVLDYDLDYASFAKSSLGANADVTSSIRGIGDHSSVVYNGTTYILSSRYIGSSDYVKTQTTTGKIAFQMPIGCSDYVVELGSYSGSKAYFKGE